MQGAPGGEVLLGSVNNPAAGGGCPWPGRLSPLPANRLATAQKHMKCSPHGLHGLSAFVFHLQGNELAGFHLTVDCENPDGTGTPTPAQQKFPHGA
jgi:hypothetical protein